MTTKGNTATRQETINRVREVRAEAIKHTVLARGFAAQRRDLLRELIDDGMSQAEIARELGVTRQAIQKMLAC
jgi:DNA invertase Pin-like site-specific DNA recombinase